MSEIEELQNEVYEKYKKLVQLRRDHASEEVENYRFESLQGSVNLLDLFGDKDTLFAIHNMGAGCRYCTLWADGINAFLPHLEARASVVLLSKDSPADQRRMANDRGWRFRLASHGGGEYIKEQSVAEQTDNEYFANYPGVVCYERKGDKVYRKNRAAFGPGDEFCSFWNLISLAGHDEETWTPQYHYWKRPEQMDDGGKNLD